MAIIGALGAAASQLIVRGARDYVEVAQNAALHARLNSAMERIDRELREIRMNPASSSAAPDITSVTTTSLAWGKASGACSLSLSGGQLLLADSGGAATALLDDATSLAIAAYGDSGAALTLPLNSAGCAGVRRIQVTVGAARNGASATLRTRVFLRCTMQGAGQ